MLTQTQSHPSGGVPSTAFAARLAVTFLKKDGFLPAFYPEQQRVAFIERDSGG
jgi:hypothetical protein